VTDSTGKVSFKTAFPGWYSGRTIHIHVRVRTFSGKTTVSNYTTQLFFAEVDNNAVLATAAYSKGGGATRDTANTADMVYQQEVAAGGAVLVPLTGSVSDGYAGSVLSVGAKRTSKRHREVTLKFHAGEKVFGVAELKRHGHILERSKGRVYAKGRHRVAVVAPNRISAGHAHLVLGLEDAHGNSAVLGRTVTLPD
jgi:hypothetical protein